MSRAQAMAQIAATLWAADVTARVVTVEEAKAAHYANLAEVLLVECERRERERPNKRGPLPAPR